MPFAYYGAKHRLAKKYPRPVHDVIVEPFAGAAGYSCHHAASGRHVILNDLDPFVVGLWHRLQTMTMADLDAVSDELTKETTTDPLIAGIGGSGSWRPVRLGNPTAVTSQMRQGWHAGQGHGSFFERIKATLPLISDWEIRCGDYRDLPDIEATWFVDPPYQELGTPAGSLYGESSDGIDYDELAEWCRSRRGQVIVCEQSPASWLPFHPFAIQPSGGGATRHELIWRNDFEQPALW